MNPYHEAEEARRIYKEAFNSGVNRASVEHWNKGMTEANKRQPSAANERQVGGTHYKTSHGIEHWDLVAMFGWDYFQAQIIRYVMRWKDKGGLQDLEKARHYLDKYLELEQLKLLENSPQVGEALSKHCPHGVSLTKFCNRCMVESAGGTSEPPALEHVREHKPASEPARVPGELLEGKVCPHGVKGYVICRDCVEEAKEAADREESLRSSQQPGHTPTPE